MTFILWKNWWRGEWRWRLVAANNRIVASSGEGYENKNDCVAAIRRVQGCAGAPIKEV